MNQMNEKKIVTSERGNRDNSPCKRSFSKKQLNGYLCTILWDIKLRTHKLLFSCLTS